jgi:uncharacterized protein YqeY
MLIDNIENDRIVALRSGDSARRSVLSFLASEARKIGKDAGNRDSTDEEVIRVIRKQIETVNENIKLRPDDVGRVSAWTAEIEILRSYLPVQMEADELTGLILTMMGDMGDDRSPKMIGSIMARLKNEHAGQYDPAMASRIVKSLLQG